jgi:hypothetical protein
LTPRFTPPTTIALLVCLTALTFACTHGRRDDKRTPSADADGSVDGDATMADGDGAAESDQDPKLQSGSGVGNALFSWPFDKIFLDDGTFVGVVDDTITLYDKKHKAVGPAEASFTVDGKAMRAPLPKRPQQVIDITDELFAINRLPDYSMPEPSADAYLVRKSDGYVWQIAKTCVNPGSFVAVKVDEKTTRVFYTTGRLLSYCQYSGMRAGNSLGALTLVTGRATIERKILLKESDAGLYDFNPSGTAAVAVSANDDDIWLKDIGATRPTAISLQSRGQSYRSFYFADGKAFSARESDGKTYILISTDDPSTGDSVLMPDVVGGAIFWVGVVGSFYAVGSLDEVYVVDRAKLEVVAKAQTPSFIHAASVVQGAGLTVAFSQDVLCGLSQAGTAVAIGCSTSADLALRGRIDHVRPLGTGRVEAFTKIAGVDEVERLVVSLDTAASKLVVESRETLSRYTPATETLVPIGRISP